MAITFSKMNGAGNDFVVVDNIRRDISMSATQVARLCNRRRGVGADGLILIEPVEDRDFYMHFYNSDGTEAEMCGNGARCAAHFAVRVCGLGTADGQATRVRFSTDSGNVSALVRGNDVSMGLMDARAMRLNIPVTVAGRERKVHFMTVGTRHVVVSVDDARALEEGEIVAWGRELRHHPEFGPQGANVNFSSVDATGDVHIRTYEKGVEAETHACGTGSVASVVAFTHEGRMSPPARVLQKGGEILDVSFEPTPSGATGVRLGGPVEVNFVGTIEP